MYHQTEFGYLCSSIQEYTTYTQMHQLNYFYQWMSQVGRATGPGLWSLQDNNDLSHKGLVDCVHLKVIKKQSYRWILGYTVHVFYSLTHYPLAALPVLIPCSVPRRNCLKYSQDKLTCLPELFSVKTGLVVLLKGVTCLNWILLCPISSFHLQILHKLTGKKIYKMISNISMLIKPNSYKEGVKFKTTHKSMPSYV